MSKRRWLLLSVVLALLAYAVVRASGGWGGGEVAPVRYDDRVRNTPPLRGVMSPTRDLTAGDLEDLASWGVTLVRFQIMRNWLKENTERDLPEYDAWFDSRLDNLDAMLPIARRLGIRLVLDFHTPPGGRAKRNVMRMFDEEEYGDHFVAVWRRIAERFRNHPDKEALWAYDLLNEPIESPESAKRGAAGKLLLRAARAVREIDPGMLLVASPMKGGGPEGFAGFEPMPLENVVYQAHMYLPFSYTHQFVLPAVTPPVRGRAGFLKYPGFVKGVMWDKFQLRKALGPVRDFQLRHGARIYIGEFSSIVWAPNAEGWLEDCIDIFEEYGWDWSYHSFREWGGFSLEHEGTPPDTFRLAPDNPRLRVFLNALGAKKGYKGVLGETLK